MARAIKSTLAALEDRALIERTLAGQTECFDVLIERHRSAVKRRINSMAGNTAYEEDLVQQVFLKAWHHLGSFRSESSFRTWIIRIAANEVMQLYRRECHSPICPASVSLDIFPSSFETPQEWFERSEATDIVREAIAGLPRMYRQILTLYYLKELGEWEIAERVQGSISMVKSRLFRARRMLAEALHRQHQHERVRSTVPVPVPTHFRANRMRWAA